MRNKKESATPSGEIRLSLRQIREMHAAIAAIPAAGIKVDLQATIDLCIFKQRLQPYVDGFDQWMKPSAEQEAYIQEARKLQLEHAVLDAYGNPVVVRGNIVFKVPSAFQSAMADLVSRRKAIDESISAKEREAEQRLAREYSITSVSISRSAFSGESSAGVEIISKLLPVIGE